MNLAKSLHTVTVYERLIAWLAVDRPTLTHEHHVALARDILGHMDHTDTYGLIDKASKKVKA